MFVLTCTVCLFCDDGLFRQVLVKLSEQLGGAIEKAQGVLLYEIAAKRIVRQTK